MSPLASAATTGTGSTGSSTGSLLILLVPLLFVAYLFFAQRRRQKAMTAMQAELTVGDPVMTTTGLFGTVAWLDDKVVHLQVAPGVVLEWDKRAILRSNRAVATDGTPDGRVDEAPPATGDQS